jgi:hypothetical protein
MLERVGGLAWPCEKAAESRLISRVFLFDCARTFSFLFFSFPQGIRLSLTTDN